MLTSSAREMIGKSISISVSYLLRRSDRQVRCGVAAVFDGPSDLPVHGG
jgi:hypothetical protein